MIVISTVVKIELFILTMDIAFMLNTSRIYRCGFTMILIGPLLLQGLPQLLRHRWRSSNDEGEAASHVLAAQRRLECHKRAP
jgi:hypothetical protein